MVPPLWTRDDSIQIREHHDLPRSTIAYISAGAGVGLVFIGIILGWIIRASRRKTRIRERRKTRQAQREKLQAVNGKYEYQPSYSLQPVAHEKAQDRQQNAPKRPEPPTERWKWNPPGDPEQTAAAIQIPPNAKFF